MMNEESPSIFVAKDIRDHKSKLYKLVALQERDPKKYILRIFNMQL